MLRAKRERSHQAYICIILQDSEENPVIFSTLIGEFSPVSPWFGGQPQFHRGSVAKFSKCDFLSLRMNPRPTRKEHYPSCGILYLPKPLVKKIKWWDVLLSIINCIQLIETWTLEATWLVSQKCRAIVSIPTKRPHADSQNGGWWSMKIQQQAGDLNFRL